MKKLVIFGAGNLARVAYVYFSKDSEYQVCGFTADSAYLTEATFMGLPAIPFERVVDSFAPEEYEMFVAVGFRRLNKARAEMYERAKAAGYRLASYISSRISSAGEWRCGDNCFLLENNVIQPFVRIGNNVVLWSGNHIGHDAVIGDHCFLSSHVVVSGNVEIGSHAFLGVNSCVKHGVKIGESCIVGAGAVILKDAAPFGVYAVKSTPRAEVSSDVVEGML